jgi:hypothetical protein
LIFHGEEALFERLQPENELPVALYMAVGEEESRFTESFDQLADMLNKVVSRTLCKWNGNQVITGTCLQT